MKIAAFPERRAPLVSEAERDGSLILLVDDDPTTRVHMCQQLATLGYTAECAANGAEALATWRSARFSLVITDCNMPVMDGFSLTREIRAIEAAEGMTRTPIIACTAHPMKGELKECLARGLDDYLRKPADVLQLRAALELWLPYECSVFMSAGTSVGSSRAR